MSDTEQLKVEAFMRDIESVNPGFAEIIESVRELFMQTHQQTVQGIKYGGLVFFINGELIGGIFPYQKHLSIEFTNGADFSDSSGLLEGKGKRRRHLKIFTAQDIEDKNALYFIQQSLGQ